MSTSALELTRHARENAQNQQGTVVALAVMYELSNSSQYCRRMYRLVDVHKL